MLRSRVLIGIHLFLLVQLFVPVTYYFQSDRYDERFAWRMFSTVRSSRCGSTNNVSRPPTFTVNGNPVELRETFHTAWITLLKRARPDVIEAMAEYFCRKNPGADVRLEYQCLDLRGKIERFESGDKNLCAKAAQ